MTTKPGAVGAGSSSVGYTLPTTKNYKTAGLITGLAVGIITAAILLIHYTSIGNAIGSKITELSKTALSFSQAHLKAVAVSTVAVAVLGFGLNRGIPLYHSYKDQHSDDIPNITPGGKARNQVIGNPDDEDGSDCGNDF